MAKEHAVRLDGNGNILPFDEGDATTNYEHMREFAKWLIDDTNASADLKARANKFYVDIRAAFENWSEKRFGDLPPYGSYAELVERYNAEVGSGSVRPAASATAVDTTSDSTDVATATPVAPRPSAPAPRPAPAPTQAAQPAPVVTSDPVPASQPAPVVERDDSVAPAWFNGFREEFAGKVNKHDATLYGEDGNAGLVADVADLQNWRREIDPDLPRNERGDYVPRTEWYNRTVTVAGRKFRYLPAVVAFVIAYLLLLLFMAPTWPDTGFWSSLYDWRKLLIAAIVFVVTLVLTNRNTSQTASAA